MGWLVNAPAALPPGITGAHCRESCVGLGAPNGIRSPNRPARSELLLQIRYPGPHNNNNNIFAYLLQVLVSEDHF